MKVYLSKNVQSELNAYIDRNCNDIQCFEVLRPVIEALIKVEHQEYSEVTSKTETITVCGLETKYQIWSAQEGNIIVVTDIFGIETLPQTRIGKRLKFNNSQIFKILDYGNSWLCGAYCGKDVIWFSVSPRSGYREGDYINVNGIVVQTSYDRGIRLSQPQTRRVQMRNETKHYRRVHLTESQLNNIIRRCINEVLQLRR